MTEKTHFSADEFQDKARSLGLNVYRHHAWLHGVISEERASHAKFVGYVRPYDEPSGVVDVHFEWRVGKKFYTIMMTPDEFFHLTKRNLDVLRKKILDEQRREAVLTREVVSLRKNLRKTIKSSIKR